MDMNLEQKIEKNLTHNDLVEFGRKWLSNKSPVVITEISSNAGESPDVIGFQCRIKYAGFGTHLIECKASRSDFKADIKKYYRKTPERGLGDFRWYLAPFGVIKKNELPKNWGLLEIVGRRIKIIKYAEFQNSNKIGEIALLISVMRRIGIKTKTVSIKIYQYETKNTATLTIKKKKCHE